LSAFALQGRRDGFFDFDKAHEAFSFSSLRSP